MDDSMGHEPTTTLTLSSYHPEEDAPTLDECVQQLDSLQTRITKTKMTYYETVTSYYSNFLNTYLYVGDLRDDVATLSDQLDQLKDRFERCGSDAYHAMQQTHPTLKAQLQRADKNFEKLYLFCKVHSQLQELDNLVDMGEFIPAATSVMEMQSMLTAAAKIQDVDWDDSIVKLIKDEFRSKMSMLRCYVNDLFAAAVQFSCKGAQSTARVTSRITTTATHSYYDNPVSIGDIWTVCDILGLVDQQLVHIVERVVHTLLHPLFQDPTATVSVEHPGNCTKLTLTTHAPRDGRQELPNGADGERSLSQAAIESCFTTLQTIHNFLVRDLLRQALPDAVDENGTMTVEIAKMMQGASTEPFDGQTTPEDGKLLQRFADDWWPRFWPLLRDKVLWCIVPDSVNDLGTFSKDYAPCIAELEKHIIQLGLNTEVGYQLSSFVHNIAHHCHRKRRNHLLATARAILLSPDMNTAEITDATERSVFRDGYLGYKGTANSDSALDSAPGKETLGKQGKETLALHDDFRFPTCRITCQTQTLLELIHQALQESINDQSADDATRQYLLVRDLLNLFLATAPVRQASQGTTSGSFVQSVLLYTDCDYITRHIVVLGRLQRDKWPASLSQVAALGDLIPEFRRLGCNAFKSMTNTQRTLLCQGIVDATSGPGARQDLRYESAEKALRSAIFQLGDWTKAFKELLPSAMYLQWLGLLVEELVGVFLQFCFQAPEITVEGARQLQYMIRVLRELDAMRYWRITKAASNEIIQASITKHVPSWPKLEYLEETLGLGKEVFSQLLQAQGAKSLSNSPCFTTAELRLLFNARFS